MSISIPQEWMSWPPRLKRERRVTWSCCHHRWKARGRRWGVREGCVLTIDPDWDAKSFSRVIWMEWWPRFHRQRGTCMWTVCLILFPLPGCRRSGRGERADTQALKLEHIDVLLRSTAGQCRPPHASEARERGWPVVGKRVIAPPSWRECEATQLNDAPVLTRRGSNCCSHTTPDRTSPVELKVTDCNISAISQI